MTRSPAGPRRQLAGSPFNVPRETIPVTVYELQDLVTHDRYGMGRVVGLEEDVAVLVDFGSCRVRIATPFSKMSKL